MAGWAALPSKVRIYICAVLAAALPLFILAFRHVTLTPPPVEWLFLTVLTLVTVPIFIFLPSVSSAVTIGDAFVMSICMLYGKSPAILSNAVYMTALTLLLRKRHSSPPHRIVFNIAAGVLNVWIYGSVFDLLNPYASRSLEHIVLPAFVLSIIFFFTNSLFVSTAISLSSGRSIFRFWYENYRYLFLDFLVSGCAGASIVAFHNIHPVAPLLAAPFVAVIWGINKINRAKAIEAERHLKEQEQLYLRTVESLALAVDAKDQTTYGHIRRVRAYALGLAQLCGVKDPQELMAIETGSLLHDIGKLAIDDYILNKPGRLSKQEFEKMKLHATAGHEILEQIQFPFPVAKYVRYHHERWDGGGYPDGLKAEQIPLGARILAIADAFDAIRSSRPYKLAFGVDESVELLKAQAGTVYDPSLIDLFVANIQKLDASGLEASKNIPELSFRQHLIAMSAAAPTDIPPQDPSTSAAVLPELVSLNEFCTSFGRQLDLAEILLVLSRRIRRVLPCNTCAFFLTNNDDTVKAALVVGDFSDTLQNMTVGLGKGISGWVAAYAKPIINSPPALEFQELGRDYSSLTDTVVVPLLVDNACVGTIALYAAAPTFYSQTHLAVLTTLADQVAPLILEAKNRPSSGAPLTDPVTQVFRASYLPAVGSQMVANAERSAAPLSILYLDVQNHSHLVNLFGVHTANTILKNTADLLRAEIRETDILIRFGHQAFIALLAGVRSEQAFRLGQRLQRQIRMAPLGTQGGQSIHVLSQVAIASYPDDGKTILSLVEAAQRTLSSQLQTQSPHAASEANVIDFPPRT